ncbi:type II toxin-antitoxin system BrnA family antitoxin [Gloeobacter kilaueensis]|uniref:CopG family transcriptional regulator n=1 Tax=Gloeobacter kilaueensis (strain ATCC BAA-2537 / CCAP 1431/1 / ULC 316 / JS1) TaxID=1183438 RepID=U5QBW1_GLOK1|nr:hypothetical protein [Gloeobacter kilaueensis]AGY56326.1 hypothetical protein GKIL_0079 [Gloeobacter kilaueensis JS1]
MKASDFDQHFDDTDQDMTAMLDISKASRPGLRTKRVNVDFPDWMVKSLDREANRLGVTRQSLIKLWIAEGLKSRGLVGP